MKGRGRRFRISATARREGRRGIVPRRSPRQGSRRDTALGLSSHPCRSHCPEGHSTRRTVPTELRSRSRASRRARAEIISKREGAVADRECGTPARVRRREMSFNPAEFSDANFDVKAWVNSACAGCVIAPSQPLRSAPRFEETRPRADRSLTFPPSPLPFPTGARAGRAWRNT
jgi:hypothetical protein